MAEYQSPKKSIKNWADDDRPREKLLLKGIAALSDAELIAIMIGSGNKSESAVDLSRRILESCDNQLHILAKKTIDELINEFNGIGEAKAISIIAALELGRRRKDNSSDERPTLKSSKDAYNYLKPKLIDLPHEEFWVLLLSRSNKITDAYKVSQGGVAGTVADVKIIFKKAIQTLSSSIIVAHNHPSGNLKPSNKDIEITQKIKDAGDLVDIKLLDHLIITDSNYFSFADEGML
jgi:DNA repair protein RadC